MVKPSDLNLFGLRIKEFLDYIFSNSDWSVSWSTDFPTGVVTLTVESRGRLTDEIIPDLEQIAYDNIPAMYKARWIIK